MRLLQVWTGVLVPALAVICAGQESVRESACVGCHGDPSVWEGEDQAYHVTVKDLASDIHWRRGLRCHDCHGGNPDVEKFDFAGAHDPESFRALGSPADIPGFCGRCHSDLEYMRRFRPSARTDQEAEYWTSGHGKQLKEDPQAPVANCVSCHGHHGILEVNNLDSPVYPTNVARTCAECHADAELMEGRSYKGRPLGHSQYENWQASVHGKALLEEGDLSAPTCNDCHGNHGALPPEVGSVANACGTCHGRVAELFEGTRMRHRFEELELPGCATCHGYHHIHHPTDEMLGMGEGTVCQDCHEEGDYGAPLAGAQVAREMRDSLEALKEGITHAGELVGRAERLGMEVRGPRFKLQEARSALTQARALIHTFSLDPVEDAIGQGLEVTETVKQEARAAMEEHEDRRIWLAASLVVIGVMVSILLLYLRRFPVPRP